ncbi:hypothetical protein GCM10022234_00070 [Aeromicrobium panaciterrae]|uniref:hypothetical protein n=1 Tax=Aeromicrobium panaciterrae TaxID=363861 RepID=UPI0031DEF9E4
MTAESDLQRAVDRLTKTVEDLRATLVNKEVYQSDQRGVAAEIRNLKDDVEEMKDGQARRDTERNADRRLLIAAFVSPLLLLVVQLYLASQGVT